MLGGRRLATPAHSKTRPTSDRVREAIFSGLTARLGTRLGDARVLDAFAGSGALGLEALSRGASHATFCEIDRLALSALRRNITELGVTEQTSVLAVDVFRIARTGYLGDTPFALLFLDPPYRINKAEVTALIVKLSARGLLAPEALIVWERATGEQVAWPAGCVLEQENRYGSTTTEIARWIGEENTR